MPRTPSISISSTQKLHHGLRLGGGAGGQDGCCRCPGGEIVDFIQDWVDHVRVIFAPLDLRFAKKSGRISAAAAFMGEALGLKPIMTFANGESKILSKARGRKTRFPLLWSCANRSGALTAPIWSSMAITWSRLANC